MCVWPSFQDSLMVFFWLVHPLSGWNLVSISCSMSQIAIQVRQLGSIRAMFRSMFRSIGSGTYSVCTVAPHAGSVRFKPLLPSCGLRHWIKMRLETHSRLDDGQNTIETGGSSDIAGHSRQTSLWAGCSG